MRKAAETLSSGAQTGADGGGSKAPRYPSVCSRVLTRKMIPVPRDTVASAASVDARRPSVGTRNSTSAAQPSGYFAA